MSKFIPKLVNETSGIFVLLDNVFAAEEGIAWAKKHNHNIKFTCGTYTCAVELLCILQEAGYTFKFVRRDAGFDGIKIEVFDTVYCYLIDSN